MLTVLSKSYNAKLPTKELECFGGKLKESVEPLLEVRTSQPF